MYFINGKPTNYFNSENTKKTNKKNLFKSTLKETGEFFIYYCKIIYNQKEK